MADQRFLSKVGDCEIVVGGAKIELRVFARSSFREQATVSVLIPVAIVVSFLICGNSPVIRFVALAFGILWLVIVRGFIQQRRDPLKPILDLEVTPSRLSWHSYIRDSRAGWSLGDVERIDIDTYFDSPKIRIFFHDRTNHETWLPLGSFHVALLLEWFLRESRVVPVRLVGEMKVYDVESAASEFPGLDVSAIRAVGEQSARSPGPS